MTQVFKRLRLHRVAGLALAFALTAAATGSTAAASPSGAGTASAAASAGGAATSPAMARALGARRSGSGGALIDHGGLVLASSKTYAIYWGPSAGFPSDLVTGMTQLLGGLNGSSYLGIAGQYMRGAGISSTFGGSVFDTNAPPTKGPKPSDLGTEVAKFFATPDPSALYLVYTSNFPHINYCAWHSYATANGVTFQVAYIPNNALAPGCSPYTVANLHANSYSDGTVANADSTAHEFMEAITDAHIGAWYDNSGSEIGDKCNFNYQGVVTLGNGSKWQIQSEWSNAINGCQQ